MLRGKPNGSHVTSGSVDLATGSALGPDNGFARLFGLLVAVFAYQIVTRVPKLK
jgi:hypothetical protein